MKVSIITPTFNSEKTILYNIRSVANQTHKNLEQIIIDNESSDKTLEIIRNNSKHNLVIKCEKDKGIYDAINKAISISKGDIVSILHSDDFFCKESVLFDVVNSMNEFGVEIIYGDLVYVKKNNPNERLRYWKSSDYIHGLFLKGWAPPHPCFFVKKTAHEQFGNYKNEIGNASDFELMYRFLEKEKIKSKYINKVFVVMRYGGKSNINFKSIINQNISIIKILKIEKNIFKIIFFLLNKILNRLIQFIDKNRNS